MYIYSNVPNKIATHGAEGGLPEVGSHVLVAVDLMHTPTDRLATLLQRSLVLLEHSPLLRWLCGTHFQQTGDMNAQMFANSW